MVFPSQFRKPHRLKGFDYSSACSYMITFVTAQRKKILSLIQQNNIYEPPSVLLTEYGKICEKHILRIPHVYPGVFIDNYVIMPDHIHLLITISRSGGDDKKTVPVSTIIHATKRMITREIGKSIWQLDFHDVIADNEKRYDICDRYIDDNPASWLMDKEPPLLFQ